ncbi:MAG: GldG family protein [Gammaproteobacteria bacterium]
MIVNNLKKQLLRWFGLIALLFIIGVFAWLTQKYHRVFDWTRDNRNSLNETSQVVLQQADKTLLITVLARNAASERQAILKQIEKYTAIKPDIDLKFLDTDKDILLAKELLLNKPNQLRLDYNSRFEIIDTISEREITNALQRLSRQSSPWVTFLTGHGERDPFNEENQGYSTLKQTLETSGVQVQDLNLFKTTFIPDNVSVLVIAAPQGTLLAGEERLIIEYVESGGSLLWLSDPQDSNDAITRPLPLLAEKLGLSWVDGTIIDANQELRSMLGIKHPAVVPVVEYQQHDITTKLKNQTLFPFAAGIAIATPETWTAQPLFYSLPRAWSEVSALSEGNVVFDSESGDTEGPLLMAASLTRAINKKSQQRIVFMGDSDFAANAYIGHGENLTLIVSALQWLTHDDQRISLLPYQPPDIAVEFSNRAIGTLAATYLLIVPLGTLLIGVFIGIRRRKA